MGMGCEVGLIWDGIWVWGVGWWLIWGRIWVWWGAFWIELGFVVCVFLEGGMKTALNALL